MAIKSSATITLIPELRDGPFILAGNLEETCQQASAIGFDAVELVISSAESIDKKKLANTLASCNVELAALSSGGGYLVHKLHLGDADPDRRSEAIKYISRVIELAGTFGAAVIIGVMKGYLTAETDHATARERLLDGLSVLADQAGRCGVTIVLEPLNRYESNFINRFDEGLDIIETLGSDHVKLLADLFHMNIEERSIVSALRQAGRSLGHVHLSDSNRQAPGYGHTDFAAIGQAVAEIGYDGYVSAEIFPHPDAQTAGRQFLRSFRQHCTQPAKAGTEENSQD